MEETIKKLNELFVARYSKTFADLNTNVVFSPVNDSCYEIPVPTLGEGGGTLLTDTQSAQGLNSPAVVKIEIKKKKPVIIVYRLAFPLSEMEVAAKNPSYFNYVMDPIMAKAVSNYAATTGGPDQMRFGKYYISYDKTSNDTDSTAFRQVNDDFLELALVGNWAGNEDA